ncbi:MAG: hypothetical protein HC923_00240 [Myxococcales bacterium]|nr:hypothetical protein [Myxococcales bacterium]
MKIKTLGDTAAATCIQLTPNTEKGAAKLYPGQVVDLPEDSDVFRSHILTNVLEVTEDLPTRPICYDTDEDAVLLNPVRSARRQKEPAVQELSHKYRLRMKGEVFEQAKRERKADFENTEIDKTGLREKGATGGEAKPERVALKFK